MDFFINSNKDVLHIIMKYLTAKDLRRISIVNKCCGFIAKIHIDNIKKFLKNNKIIVNDNKKIWNAIEFGDPDVLKYICEKYKNELIIKEDKIIIEQQLLKAVFTGKFDIFLIIYEYVEYINFQYSEFIQNVLVNKSLININMFNKVIIFTIDKYMNVKQYHTIYNSDDFIYKLMHEGYLENIINCSNKYNTKINYYGFNEEIFKKLKIKN